MRKIRDIERENLFERWLTEVVQPAGSYEDYERFSDFSARITVSDTVHGGVEASPAPEKREELSNQSEGSTNPGNADPCTQVHQSSKTVEPPHGELF